MSKETLRYQVVLNKEKVERIKEMSGAASNQELLNSALTLLAWALKEKASGKVVGSIDEDASVIKEVVMPILDEVRSPTQEVASTVAGTTTRAASKARKEGERAGNMST